MKVFTIEQDPSAEEIVRTLEKDFSSGLTYRFFGFGKNKSIIVRQSEFVGAQISKCGNQITVHVQPPNLALTALDAMTGINVIGTVFHNTLQKLEADLVAFLKNRYA